MSAPALRTLMDDLQRLLQELDPEAGERAQALAELLPPGLSAARDLVRQAQAFDFENALLSLQALRETLT